MRKTKQYKTIGIIVIVLILVTAFVLRVRYVNAQYPKISWKQYEIGQNFEWHDFNVTVTGYEILNADQISERWENADVSAIKAYDIIIATIQVTYHGEDDKISFPITEIRGQAGAWSNASELFSLKTFNNGNVTCKKGETRDLYTAIGLSYKQFSPADWKTHKERSYDLIFQTYPDNVRVKLK